MNVSIRTCPSTPTPSVRPFADRRVRAATGRFAHRVQNVDVDVSRESPHEGGRFACRLTGTLADGGQIVVRGHDKSARVAVATSVARFRHTLARSPRQPRGRRPALRV